jgi:hypothetical protein
LAGGDAVVLEQVFEIRARWICADDAHQTDVAPQGLQVAGDVGCAAQGALGFRRFEDGNRRLRRDARDVATHVLVEHDVAHDEEGKALWEVGDNHVPHGAVLHQRGGGSKKIMPCERGWLRLDNVGGGL